MEEEKAATLKKEKQKGKQSGKWRKSNLKIASTKTWERVERRIRWIHNYYN